MSEKAEEEHDKSVVCEVEENVRVPATETYSFHRDRMNKSFGLKNHTYARKFVHTDQIGELDSASYRFQFHLPFLWQLAYTYMYTAISIKVVSSYISGLMAQFHAHN